jgi:uncharacterized tellurite resistance protein B-like protein
MTSVTSETLAAFVDRSLPIGAELDSAALKRILDSLGIDATDRRVRMALESAVRESLDASGTLAWDPGGWKIKVTGQAIQGVVVAGMMYAVLTALKLDLSLLGTVVPAVMPMLFAVERVKLTTREKELHAALVLSDKVRLGTPEELYASLPASVQSQVNPLDFADFVSKLADAGKAERLGYREFLIARPGNSRLRVTFE